MFILECLGAGVVRIVSFTEWWTKSNTSTARFLRQKSKPSTTLVAEASVSRHLHLHPHPLPLQLPPRLQHQRRHQHQHQHQLRLPHLRLRLLPRPLQPRHPHQLPLRLQLQSACRPPLAWCPGGPATTTAMISLTAITVRLSETAVFPWERWDKPSASMDRITSKCLTRRTWIL